MASGPQSSTLFKSVDITEGVEYADGSHEKVISSKLQAKISELSLSKSFTQRGLSKDASRGKLLFRGGHNQSALATFDSVESPKRQLGRPQHQRERSNQSSCSSVKLLQYNKTLSKLNDNPKPFTTHSRNS